MALGYVCGIARVSVWQSVIVVVYVYHIDIENNDVCCKFFDM